MPYQRSEEDEDLVAVGSLLKRLTASPEWTVYVQNVEVLARYHTQQALQPGSTDYHKGIVEGLRLATQSHVDTIAMYEELLQREAELEQEAEEHPIAPKREFAP